MHRGLRPLSQLEADALADAAFAGWLERDTHHWCGSHSQFPAHSFGTVHSLEARGYLQIVQQRALIKPSGVAALNDWRAERARQGGAAA
jgi:hypothetical protein